MLFAKPRNATARINARPGDDSIVFAPIEGALRRAGRIDALQMQANYDNGIDGEVCISLATAHLDQRRALAEDHANFELGSITVDLTRAGMLYDALTRRAPGQYAGYHYGDVKDAFTVYVAVAFDNDITTLTLATVQTAQFNNPFVPRHVNPEVVTIKLDRNGHSMLINQIGAAINFVKTGL